MTYYHPYLYHLPSFCFHDTSHLEWDLILTLTLLGLFICCLNNNNSDVSPIIVVVVI